MSHNLAIKIEIQWREIPNFPGYQISEYGQVVSIRTGKELYKNYSGRKSHRYRSVQLFRAGKYYKLLLHKLVYFVFYGEVPDGYQVDHIDRNRFNNHVANLQLLESSANRARRQYNNCVSVEPDLPPSWEQE